MPLDRVESYVASDPPAQGLVLVARALVDNHRGAVAIVDDDPGVLDSLKFLLEVTGHAVVTYDSAAAFLEDRGTRPACLVVDHFMPHMTGLDLVARLRLEGADLPVLLITSSPSPAIIERAAQLAIDTVLEKPLDEHDLLRFLDAHC